MAVGALVLAAGRGERLGYDLPKGFVPVAGVPMLVRSVVRLAAVASIDCVLPVIPADERARYDALGLAGRPKVAAPVAGGAERQDSVRAGLAALPADVEIVAVHDAARCLVEAGDVERVIQAARQYGAALLAVPALDTIKRVRDGRVCDTPPRAECWLAQTPQVFRVDLLREAVAKATDEGFLGTDDAQLAERLGIEVQVVEGSPRNLKITRPEDLTLAEQWLREAGEAEA